MTKTIVAMAISAALVIPAAAQATFYVVQDTKTKRCSVVKERPTATTMVVVGDSGKVYTTEAEAQAAVRTIKVCETKYPDRLCCQESVPAVRSRAARKPRPSAGAFRSSDRGATAIATCVRRLEDQ